jgi:hypothetical protein
MDLTKNATFLRDKQYKCTDVFLLDLFYSNIFILWFSRVLVFILMIYLYIGIGKITEIFLTSIENFRNSIFSTVQIDNENDLIKNTTQNHEKNICRNYLVNSAIQYFGFNYFELIFILIELIKTFKSKVYSTTSISLIIGTSSFNILLVTACCLLSLQSAKSKFFKIKNYSLFINFTIWSSMSFIWLYSILYLISPNRIDLWESLTTIALNLGLLINWFLINRRKYSNDQIKKIVSEDDEGYIIFL